MSRRVRRGVSFNYTIFVQDYLDGESEIRRWVSQHVLGTYEVTMLSYAPGDWRVAYLFTSERDAAIFKLRWG